jgi:hypothetical protein
MAIPPESIATIISARSAPASIAPAISALKSLLAARPAAVILSGAKDLRRKHRIIPQNEYRVKRQRPPPA